MMMIFYVIDKLVEEKKRNERNEKTETKQFYREQVSDILWIVS